MASRVPHIFLDCDGVLADFDKYTVPLFGMDLPPREVEAQIGSEQFWRVLRSHPDFYFKLPLMPDAAKLFAALAHLKPTILTGCPPGGWAEPQKLAWAAHHFPGTPMITCVARDKRQHMQTGEILIDDTAKYRHLWEEARGIFIHHTSANSTLDALRALGMLE